MRGKQIFVVVACILLFCLIYFGLDTKPKDQQSLEKSRAEMIESTGIQNLLSEARTSTAPSDLALIDAHMSQLDENAPDSIRVTTLMDLSSAWYKAKKPIISGYYAEEIAKLKKDKASWSIAGTTYYIGMMNAQAEKNASFARNRAIRAFENAISMDPESVEDQVNLALIYVERPDENPMQGILMLRSLNEKYPENVSIMNQLAQLALRTNQIDKALERLKTALALEPDNTKTHCLLVQAYQAMGDNKMAAEHAANCN